MCPPPAEDPIQAAIERSRQRREEAIRRESSENKKVVPTGDIGRPAPAEPRREATSAPDLADKPKPPVEEKKKRRAKSEPDMITEPKRKKGGEPQLVREAERKKGGAPEMILEPERKKSGGPELVEMPQEKKGGAPELVEGPQAKKMGGPELVRSPQARKGAGAELVESPKLKKGADPVMIKVPQRGAAAAQGQDRPGGSGADDGSDDASAVVEVLARQLENTVGKQGVGWEIEHSAPLAITLSSGPKTLVLHFQSSEAVFDTLEIRETRTVKRRHRKPGMFSGLKRLFGGDDAEEDTEEYERLMLGRNPAADGRSFEWETDAEESVLSTVSVSVTADYEDQNRRHEFEIRLGLSEPDAGGGASLSRAGAVRAVNAVFAGLQEALSG